MPRVAEPLDTVPERSVRSITTAPSAFEGEGLPVRRALAGIDLALLDPFVHLDQMGEVEYAPGEPKGTPWHPHRGFETVTYMIDGTFEHQESNGGGGVITNGDTQWMTAGADIQHIERTPESLVVSGGLFHGFQLWVNLPARDKFLAPRYQDLRGGEVVLLSTPDGSALIRLIAGDLDEHRGPGHTHAPITMAHVTISPGARLHLSWHADFNARTYVLNGAGRFGTAGTAATMGQLMIYGPGAAITAASDARQESRSPNLDLLLSGGQPIGEPVVWCGPFVMNSCDELVQVFEDYRHGRLGVMPGDA